jgi:hypothetical protein
MICLPTLVLGVVLTATFLAHLFKGYAYNAMLTFFFTLVVLVIVHYACLRAGDIAGWIAIKLFNKQSCGCLERQIYLNELFGCPDGIKL